MNWDTLFSMQKDLDQFIAHHHQLEEKDLVEERFLALLVELGELANETRCFKFWSKKPRSSAEIIIEEYVDNIHFLLSIGLSKGYTFSKIAAPAALADETKAFNQVFAHCMTFYQSQTEENYLSLFQAYLQLANILGFSEEDIIAAYHEKNEVNYARQQNGY